MSYRQDWIGRYHKTGPRQEKPAMSAEELRAYRAAQPPDDRTPMQKLLGDPPSWRSALANIEIAEPIE
jgi:hypothetical protein